MRRGRSRRQVALHEEPLINLTPLIDVVFVILIMFIVVAPLVEVDTIELAASSPQLKELSSALQNSHAITIHVRQDNTLLFNQQQVSFSELKALLKSAKDRSPSSEVPQLFHDKAASFGTYQTIKNAIEEAGFTHLDVILKPD